MSTEIRPGRRTRRSYRWSDLQELIFLDRYARKGPRETIAAGDTVVVLTKDHPRYPQKDVGVVQAIDGDQATVELRSGERFTQVRSKLDKPLELTPEDMWEREARAIVEVESPERQQELEAEFRWLLDGWRFVPGGRINAMLGTGQKLTAYNCYVLPLRPDAHATLRPAQWEELSRRLEVLAAEGRPAAELVGAVEAVALRNQPEAGVDSRRSIMDTLRNMVEVMSRGGGVGINLSPLRPRLAYVQGVNGKSSGAVSWGGLFSFATGLVEQGGSRRGALMLILNVWHPDVIDFVNAKRDFAAITNANISVGITADFERAVDEDGEWELVFPDYEAVGSEVYDREWDGSVERWRAKGYPVKVYQRVRARELWRMLVESAWASAEPGIVRIDYCNQMSNSYYFHELICTNPCAEQPLPAWGVCNLGHLNLARFVRPGGWERSADTSPEEFVDWESLGRAARLGVRFLDNIIDYTPYFFEENVAVQKAERRIGMGTMGLGEMLIRLGLRYGSPESLRFIDTLYAFIAREAYLASVELAREKGPFPLCDPERYVESGFMRGMPDQVRQAVRQHGIRNVTLLTQAPTGTTGTLVGTSTGIEPYYQWTYLRRGRLGTKEVREAIVDEWLADHPGGGGDLDRLPSFFVTALELTPEEHVRVQAAVQRWVDSSISKTCNVPSDWTVDQVGELYDLARRLGCKGVTIYRDLSRDEQVLSRKEAAGVGQAGPGDGARDPASIPLESNGLTELAGETIGEVPEEVQGITYRQKTLVGTARITVNEKDGEPFETIIVMGKGGMDITADSEAIGRLISLYLRTPSPVPNLQKLALVVDQLRGIGGANPFGFGPNKVLSLPDALAKALERYLRQRDGRGGDPGDEADEPAPEAAAAQGTEHPAKAVRSPGADLCPACGSWSFVRNEGCGSCRNCGFSNC